MRREKMYSNEFIRQMQTAHLFKVAAQLEILHSIDNLVYLMGKDLPEAKYIIQKIQETLRDDGNY